ncbi:MULTISPECIES: hypothetical protein [Gordonia]|uniref:Low molecular weight antigen MTB12-like C-terminal domain-containing protein n=1 Tax=Gordonia amicalis TaxID=89053 RepID=A0AAE4R675_9ACTN|nr:MULTISPECIES: hypothetical protein [Gordonia]ATD69319.1 hypothetical protein CNO18_02410 [Gordonia sp. 1D]KAF0971164.1 hypothetical protein BPODLACK_00347 [Gordonia sp. YY1]MBA5846047.1 hypothetical protein [Gordonia amicalis]MCZ4581301.1 hypothetical protein [Gordonia amicalis]MDJ0451963.1 hypothetical protein [Gordonia amicalis]
MQNDVGYQDPGYVGDTHEPEAGSEKRSGGVSIPTVLASAGVAAVISAIVVTIGVVGIVVSERNDTASAAQPTVVNLGSAQAPQQQGLVGPAATQQPAAAPGQPAPAAAPAPAATENVPESGGTVGAGPDAAAPAPAPAPGTSAAPPQQQAAAAPTALTPGQLNTKVKIVMNSRGNRAARAAELQGGERALRQIDAVAQAITTYGNVGLSYQMVGPVQISGNKMTAPLQISVVGRGSQNRAMTWVWSGDKWKLSNSSVCLIASFVLLPCSL